MKKYRIIFLLFLFLDCPLLLEAQARNDYNWILGYPPNDSIQHFGGVRINFNANLTSPDYFNTNCLALFPTSLSSNSGTLLTYSNGCSVFNSDHQIMENGDSIAYGRIWDNYCNEIGYPGNQNKLLISWPEDTAKALLLYLKTDDNYIDYYLMYATIQFNIEHPLGIVTSKDNLLIKTGITGLITAAKHGNGRDWWIILPEHGSNRFFKMILQPSGISVIDTQAIGLPWSKYNHSSQAIFSPNGQYYIRFNPWKGLDIFDFDRCSGELSNPRESGPLSDPIKTAGGVACSTDSKYLYVSNVLDLFQYDLEASDIISSKIIVGQFDGYASPFPLYFYQMALAPNGKIYVFSTNGTNVLHSINNPNLKGDSCTFIQHSLKLPAYTFTGSINLPFYRLGPEDGSFCDSLDINNSPIADFRYEVDSLNQEKVYFNNLSYFDPKEFYWTFGDNTNSNINSPTPHLYAGFGEYTVCLTVSNEYGTNTLCRTINLMDSITNIIGNTENKRLKVGPNPFNTELFIIKEEESSELAFILYSAVGSVVFSNIINKEANQINLPDFPKGLYFYCIRQKGDCIQTGKLIKSD